MLLRVSFGGEQKYIKMPELTFGDFLREVSLKFYIPEDRRLEIKVHDQSNTEVDSEVFEEIVKEFRGPFLVSLANEAPGYPQSTSSPCSIASEDTVIPNFSVCDPAEEPVAAEGSQPKRPCRINYEAKALVGQAMGLLDPFTADKVLTDEVESAIAVLRHSADEDTIREKMKVIFSYRHAMVNDDDKSAEVFSVFPRFLDTPGLTANKFLERWPTNKTKVIKESHGLVPSTDFFDLMRNAETSTEVENGWDNDMSAIILLLHLLLPSAQGRKRTGKISASHAVDDLIKFQKVH
ncbi:hypothetical protein ACEWY4_025569 [Coilia grayii]|uniref:PB1 domain-containing protein n=1 Tax=Coilia grayii TaxID=363190 RepID=A0ABD1IZX5_9TELE